MTKEQFELRYCVDSGITLDEYAKECNLITLPCNCGLDGCDGWAAVDNNQRSIESHNRLYNR